MEDTREPKNQGMLQIKSSSGDEPRNFRGLRVVGVLEIGDLARSGSQLI